jgi:hypothetical protein
VVFFGNKLESRFYEKLKDYYSEDPLGPWTRLEKNRLWVLQDLKLLFIDWPSILDEMKMLLNGAEQNADKETYPVMVQTRLLHMQIRAITDLRESMRISQAVVKRAIFLIGMYQLKGDYYEANPYYPKKDFDLVNVFRATDDQLSYSLITINAIAEQLQNLLQLVRLLIIIILCRGGVDLMGIIGIQPGSSFSRPICGSPQRPRFRFHPSLICRSKFK